MLSNSSSSSTASDEPTSSTGTAFPWEGVVVGVLVFLSVVLAYLAYRYVDWRRLLQLCCPTPGSHEAMGLNSTSTEALLMSPSSRNGRLVV